MAPESEPPEATWPDDTSESEFRADARNRGEPVSRAPEAEESAGESNGEALPKLDDLVARIPAGVRETLEELFRARFVAVKRMPRKAFNLNPADQVAP